MRRIATKYAREGRRQAAHLFERFAAELRMARLEVGLTQRHIAGQVGISQPFVSMVEHGLRRPNWPTLCAMASVVGLDVSVRAFQARTVSLRDSGQFLAVQHLADQAHRSWQPKLELPVSRAARDRRAADLVLIGPGEAIHVEVERSIVDFQAQLRRCQLKRSSLTELLERPVRLVIAVPGTRRSRTLMTSLQPALGVALPAETATVWRSIRSGVPLGMDGLLFLPAHL